MAVKVFILGRPGSSKTTVARYIEKFAKKHHNWSTIQFNDYEIFAGFDISDFSGLDRAEIALLEKHVRQKYSLKDELIVIELRLMRTLCGAWIKLCEGRASEAARSEPTRTSAFSDISGAWCVPPWLMW